MIVVQIKGGLGNQMLQFAAGYAQSLRLNAELQLDVYPLTHGLIGNETPRDYELDRFKQCRVTKKFRLPALETLSQVPPLAKWYYQKAISGFGRLTGLTTVDVGRFSGIEAFHEHGDNLYLKGYFFSSRYFLPYLAQIREAFTFPAFTTPGGKQWAEQIDGEENAVAIHFRRTDFLLAENDHLGSICGPAYYQRALHAIEERLGAVPYFIFSDDLAWAREQPYLPAGRTYFVDPGTEDAVDNMHLMARCKHHIVANSTFSWWAALLKQAPNGLTYAPNPWLADNSDPGGRKIIPEGWVRIPSQR